MNINLVKKNTHLACLWLSLFAEPTVWIPSFYGLSFFVEESHRVHLLLFSRPLGECATHSSLRCIYCTSMKNGFGCFNMGAVLSLMNARSASGNLFKFLDSKVNGAAMELFRVKRHLQSLETCGIGHSVTAFTLLSSTETPSWFIMYPKTWLVWYGIHIFQLWHEDDYPWAFLVLCICRRYESYMVMSKLKCCHCKPPQISPRIIAHHLLGTGTHLELRLDHRACLYNGSVWMMFSTHLLPCFSPDYRHWRLSKDGSWL